MRRDRTGSNHRTVLRPGFAFWLYLVLAAASIAAIVSTAIPEGTRHHLPQLAPIPIAIVLGGWVALGRPALVVERERLVVRNPFTTIEVPAARLRGYDTERGLALLLDDGGRVHVWAAPPPDRLSVERFEGRGDARRDPRLLREVDDTVRASRLPGTPSGDAAMVLEHQRRARERAARDATGSTAGGEATGADAPVVRSVSVASILIAVAAVVVPIVVANL